MSRNRGNRREQRRQVRESRRVDASRRDKKGRLQTGLLWGLIIGVVAIGIGALIFVSIKGTVEEGVGRQVILEAPSHV
ncbi:MAG: hypothetical protein HW403_768, partial [Dehalococcoidia bacterium]|nr:hypothetical protein [Dehalococcoidia bacterium]